MSSTSTSPKIKEVELKYGVLESYKSIRPSKREINDHRYRKGGPKETYAFSSTEESWPGSKYKKKSKRKKERGGSNPKGPSSLNYEQNAGQTSSSSSAGPQSPDIRVKKFVRKSRIDLSGAGFDKKIEKRLIVPLFGEPDQQINLLKKLADEVLEPSPTPKPETPPWDYKKLTHVEDDHEIETRIVRETERQRYVYQSCLPDPGLKHTLKNPKMHRDKRLSTRFKKSIDKIRDLVVRPGHYLQAPWPIWKELDLDQKLPYFQDSLPIIITRGKIGRPLLVNVPNPEFDLSDPNGRTTIPEQNYNALHDPHSQRYFNSPYVKKLLIAQGLLTNEDDVICSMKELNEFRHYVKRYEDVEVLRKQESLQERRNHRFEIVKQVENYYKSQAESPIEVFKSKLPNPELELIERYERRKAMKKKLELAEQRRQDYIRKQDDKFFEYRKREKEVYSRYLQLQGKEEEESERKRLEIEDKWIERENRQNQLLEKKCQLEFLEEEKKYKEYYDSLVKKDRQRKEKQIKVNTLREDRKFRVEQRRLKHDKQYEQFLRNARLRKAKWKDEERKWNLARKYFFIWLRKVREKRKTRNSNNLHSNWDVNLAAKRTVKYIQKESGAEHVNTFLQGWFNAAETKSKKLNLSEGEDFEVSQDESQSETDDDHEDYRETESYDGDDEENELQVVLPQMKKIPNKANKFKKQKINRSRSRLTLKKI